MSVIINDEISLTSISPPFRPKLTITPTQFNLFTGMNGSGKTFLLNHITNLLNQKNREQKTNVAIVPIREDRFYAGKLQYVKAQVDLSNIVNTANIAPETPEKKQLNEDLQYLFQREVDMITDRGGNPAPNFRKSSGNVHVSADGRGIVNTWTILEYVAHSPMNFPLIVEEISLSLHPSLLEKFLDRLFMRLNEKKMQLFATTQDPFTVFYFLKNKLSENCDWNDTNPDYSVFHFSDNSDGLNVEKITKENIYSSMNDLMGDFQGSPDLQKFNMLFSKKL